MTITIAELMLAVLIAVVAYFWNTRKKTLILPASTNDWFIIVDTNVNARKVTISFFPILAFKLKKGFCVPITSRPDETDPLLSATHVASAELATKTSEKYGRWFRHGIRYDVFGSPCWSGLHFPVLLSIFHAAQFGLIAIDPPPEYALLIDNYRNKAHAIANR